MVGKSKGAQIHLFISLYVDSCRLEFSRDTDKPFAISGLEQRLTRQLSDVSGAGIFGQHKGRLLLWRRSKTEEQLKRIKFEMSSLKPHKPPSWSFMAYKGAIEYIKVPGKIVNWADLNLRLTGTAETSWLYADQPLIFYASALSFDIDVATDRKHEITFDDPNENTDGHRCVVLGTTTNGESYYILVVRPRQREASARCESGRKSYERAGAGYIAKEWVTRESIDIEIL